MNSMLLYQIFGFFCENADNSYITWIFINYKSLIIDPWSLKGLKGSIVNLD